MGIILAPIALFLFSLVGIVHTILTPVQLIYRRAFFKQLHNETFNFAFDVDVFGNYLFRNTWNLIFCKKGCQYFGIFGETISSCLGKILRDKKASWFGYAFAYFLNAIWVTDWLKGGHCKASIMSHIRIVEIRNSYL